MFVEVGVHIGRVIDGRKADDPRENRSSIRVHLAICPCRAVLAAVDCFPMCRVDRAVNGCDSWASIWDRLNVVAAFAM